MNVPDLELVQVRVSPTHCHLDDDVQARQLDVLRHEQSPPDRRCDVDEGDPELVHVVRQAEPLRVESCGLVILGHQEHSAACALSGRACLAASRLVGGGYGG
jgi:hypothetical protein